MEVKTELDEFHKDNQTEMPSGTEVTVAPTEPPKRPQKPKSAYLLFVDDQREQKVFESGVDSDSCDQTSKRFRHLWRNADRETREKYQLQAEQAKAKYPEDMEEYWMAMVAYGESNSSHIMKKRPRSDVDYSKLNSGPEFEEEVEEEFAAGPTEPQMPKPPNGLYAYHFFAADHKEIAVEKGESRNMGKILGNMWRNVDEETKKKYERKAEKAKEMYAVEMEEYWKAMEAFQAELEEYENEQRDEQMKKITVKKEKDEQAENISRKKLNVAPKKRQKRKPQQPKKSNSVLFSAELPNLQEPKPPKSAYKLFADDHRASEEKESVQGSDRLYCVPDRLRRMWMFADAVTKEKYLLRAEKAKEKYAEDIEEFKAETIKQMEAFQKNPRGPVVDYSNLCGSSRPSYKRSRKDNQFVVKMEMSDKEEQNFDLKTELAQDDLVKLEIDRDDEIKEEVKVEIMEE